MQCGGSGVGSVGSEATLEPDRQPAVMSVPWWPLRLERDDDEEMGTPVRGRKIETPLRHARATFQACSPNVNDVLSAVSIRTRRHSQLTASPAQHLQALPRPREAEQDRHRS